MISHRWQALGGVVYTVKYECSAPWLAQSILMLVIYFSVPNSALSFDRLWIEQGELGLSGALHGLFVWGAMQDIRLGRRMAGWLVLVGSDVYGSGQGVVASTLVT